MDLLQPPLLYVVIAVAVLVVAAVVWAAVSSARKKRERDRLQQHYGTEYDRTLADHRSTRAAVEDLRQREAEHENLELRDLNEADRDLVRRHMAAAQFRFVEDPVDALQRTERIMAEVLKAKGYPVAQDREQARKLFSVDHPDHAESLRTMFDRTHDSNVDGLRERFLQARKTIAEITGTTFEAGDAMGTTDDLRVEHRPDATADASATERRT